MSRDKRLPRGISNYAMVYNCIKARSNRIDLSTFTPKNKNLHPEITISSPILFLSFKIICRLATYRSSATSAGTTYFVLCILLWYVILINNLMSVSFDLFGGGGGVEEQWTCHASSITNVLMCGRTLRYYSYSPSIRGRFHANVPLTHGPFCC